MITPRRLAAALFRRMTWLIHGRPKAPAHLEMVWPEAQLASPPSIVVPHGYTLRQYKPADQKAYFNLLAAADMFACDLNHWEKHILPGGFFVIEHDESGALVATCMASHYPAPRHPRAGNFGWLAADPAHKGRQLGRAVAVAVTARLIAGGYRRMYLETHDFRLAALKVYLAMGWVPLLYQEDMHTRWKFVCEQLEWPFAANEWPKI